MKGIQDSLGFWIPVFVSRTWVVSWCADTNDAIQKNEKTLNNTHTTTQKLTNNSFRNTKKHPELGFRIPIVSGIPDSKTQDSGFHKQKFPGFRIPDSLT